MIPSAENVKSESPAPATAVRPLTSSSLDTAPSLNRSDVTSTDEAVIVSSKVRRRLPRSMSMSQDLSVGAVVSGLKPPAVTLSANRASAATPAMSFTTPPS